MIGVCAKGILDPKDLSLGKIHPLYYKGETVLIRVRLKGISQGKEKLAREHMWRGDANHSMHKCFISYSDPETLKSETKWFKVCDVTSVTKEEENDQQ